MSKKTLTLLCLLSMVIAIHATDPWGEPVVYPGSMVVMAQVSINGSPAAVGDMLGAFILIDGVYQLRGKEAVITVGNIQGCMLQVFCDINGETIHFRVWDSSAEAEYIATETTVTEVNGSVGSYPDNMFHINGLSGEIEAPQINPASGSYPSPLTVSIVCNTPGVQIRYTMDGEEPNSGSSLYNSPLILTQSCTLQARAYLGGLTPSPVSTAVYTISQTVANPVFTPDTGFYYHPIVLQMFCNTALADIYFTLDTSEPDIGSTLYTGPILITQPTLVKARAFRDSWIPSEIVSAEYVFPSANQDSQNLSTSPVVLDVYPNPFIETVSLRLKGNDHAGNYMLSIYNHKGQRVYHRAGLLSGSLDLVWEAKDASGSKLSSGLYFVRLQLGDQLHLRKLIRF